MPSRMPKSSHDSAGNDTGAEGANERSDHHEPELRMVTVRYIVQDVPESVAFYTGHLGFAVALDARPGFALVARGPLRLALSAVSGPGGGSRPVSDGRRPEPGGWNRIQLLVGDLAAEVARLRAAGARFRNEIVKGNGGLQILLDDPSGNPIELFQAY
jgi:catechol 2,3-dioxygenase-like lactoylglutathione lyase family enzyme